MVLQSGDGYDDVIVYTTTHGGTFENSMIALNGVSGQTIWEKSGLYSSSPVSYIIGVSSHGRPSVVVNGLNPDVKGITGEDWVTLIDSVTATPIWKIPRPEGAQRIYSLAAVAGSSSGSADDLLVGTDAFTARLDGKTGVVKWMNPAVKGATSFASQPSAKADIYVGTSDRLVYRMEGWLKHSASLTLSTNTPTVKEGSNIVVTGVLALDGPSDSAKATASKAEIQISVLKPDAIIERKTVRPSDRGIYSLTLTSVIPGNWTLTASWQGNDDYQSAKPSSVVVEVLSETQVVTAKAEADSLRSLVQTLQTDIEGLKQKIRTSESEIDRLTSQINSLRSAGIGAKAQIETLTTQLSSLTQEKIDLGGMLKSKSVEFDRTRSLLAETESKLFQTQKQLDEAQLKLGTILERIDQSLPPFLRASQAQQLPERVAALAYTSYTLVALFLLALSLYIFKARRAKRATPSLAVTGPAGHFLQKWKRPDQRPQ